jgi:hypothetical protein
MPDVTDKLGLCHLLGEDKPRGDRGANLVDDAP